MRKKDIKTYPLSAILEEDKTEEDARKLLEESYSDYSAAINDNLPKIMVDEKTGYLHFIIKSENIIKVNDNDIDKNMNIYYKYRDDDKQDTVLTINYSDIIEVRTNQLEGITEVTYKQSDKQSED